MTGDVNPSKASRQDWKPYVELIIFDPRRIFRRLLQRVTVSIDKDAETSKSIIQLNLMEIE